MNEKWQNCNKSKNGSYRQVMTAVHLKLNNNGNFV